MAGGGFSLRKTGGGSALRDGAAFRGADFGSSCLDIPAVAVPDRQRHRKPRDKRLIAKLLDMADAKSNRGIEPSLRKLLLETRLGQSELGIGEPYVQGFDR